MKDVSRARLLTDTDNAARLAAHVGKTVRYVGKLARWRIFDGLRWRDDEAGQMMELAKEVARSWLVDASREENDGARDALIAHARRSEQLGHIRAMIKLAESVAGIPAAPETFDANPMFFGCANGVIDLHQGEFRTSQPADYISRTSPIAYEAGAKCPRWARFLDRIMAGNDRLIDYLQRIGGMSLSGDIGAQELYVMYGSGANGKSVLLDTWLYVMGEYATVAPESLLTVRSHVEHACEIADLCGRRLVIASETEAGAKLRVQLVKRLTGDAKLKGRFMRENFFEFPRTHKTVLVTNHKPRIDDSGNAIWRRVRLIPFGVTIPADEQDPNLIDKLKAEASGILRWLVEGALKWGVVGMEPPEEVLIATETYRSESDPISDFIADKCVRGTSKVRAGRGELYDAYRSWCGQVGERDPMDNRAFYEAIRAVAGVEEGQWKPEGVNVPVRGFKGIGLAFNGIGQANSHEAAAAEGAGSRW
jgi:putative DNA primase/helicase